MRDLNSLNRVILIGRLGQKPEMRVIPQGDRSVARFTLATNERIYNPGTSETSDRTEWHKIVVWGKLAEFCEKYLDKGRQVAIEGKLRSRSWQDRDGNKRSSTEIEAQSVVLLGGRREGVAEAEPRADMSGAADFPAEDEAQTPGEGEGDDEVPF
jgi:single-strand DNA-binding protein